MSRRLHQLLLHSLPAALFITSGSLSAEVTVGQTQQISVNSTDGSPNGKSSFAATGGNAQGLAFASNGADLVSGDSNGTADVFYVERKTSQITRASISAAGSEGNAGSGSPSISPVLPSGFFAIAFESSATNLSERPNTPNFSNIYVRLPTLGVTGLVSEGVGSTLPNDESFLPSITTVLTSNNRNKAIVTYYSLASNLVPNDTNSQTDVFVTEAIAPTTRSGEFSLPVTTRISKAAVAGEELDGGSFRPKISGDGRYVVYLSRATNIVSPALPSPNFNAQVYRHDRVTGTTIMISKDSSGAPGNNESLFAETSYNGRYIAYGTYATNLATAPGAQFGLNFLRYDAATGTTARINVNAQGQVGSGVGSLTLSPSGRLVAFSDAAALIPADTNNLDDIFVKDMDTGDLELVSRGVAGTGGNAPSAAPSLTADTLNSLTNAVAFESAATNLFAGSVASGIGDIFLSSLTISPPVVSTQTRIDVPPDAVVRSRTVSFSSQKFQITESNQSSADSLRSSRAIRYEWAITSTNTVGGKRRTLRTLTRTKRNTLTVSKLRKTNYRARTRVLVVDSRGKTIFRTPYSPTQSFKT
jgi:hypothetical protein